MKQDYLPGERVRVRTIFGDVLGTVRKRVAANSPGADFYDVDLDERPAEGYRPAGIFSYRAMTPLDAMGSSPLKPAYKPWLIWKNIRSFFGLK